MEYSFESMYDFFKQQVICGICYDPVFKNVECYNCSCLFCLECITELDKYYERLSIQHDKFYRIRCPHCRSTSRFYENPFVTRVLGQMELECNHCNEKIKYSNYNNHLDICVGKIVHCVLCGKKERTKLHKCKYTTCLDCNSLIRKSDNKKHLKTCSHRLIDCQYCGTRIKFKDNFIHNSLKCEMYPLTCTFCNEIYHRKDLRQHISVCSKRVIDCVICKTQYKRSEKHNCVFQRCFICKGIYIKGYLLNHINGRCETLNNHEKRIKRQQKN